MNDPAVLWDALVATTEGVAEAQGMHADAVRMARGLLPQLGDTVEQRDAWKHIIVTSQILRLRMKASAAALALLELEATERLAGVQVAEVASLTALPN